MQLQGFKDLASNSKNWIQRSARLLENITHYSAADLTKLGFGHFQYVAATQQNLPRRISCRRARHQARNGERSDALAAAALAYEAHCLAGIDCKRNSIHGAQRLGPGNEFQPQVLDFQ